MKHGGSIWALSSLKCRSWQHESCNLFWRTLVGFCRHSPSLAMDLVKGGVWAVQRPVHAEGQQEQESKIVLLYWETRQRDWHHSEVHHCLKSQSSPRSPGDLLLPKVEVTVEHRRFFITDQANVEGTDSSRILAATGNFGNLTDSLIWDKTICSTGDHHLQEQLHQESELALDRCLNMGRAAEASRERMKVIGGTTHAQVYAVRQQQRRQIARLPYP